MLEVKISEIKDHLLEVEAETGTLTEEQIEESVQAIRDAIDEHYKIADIPDPQPMIEAQAEETVQMINEIMAKNKPRLQFEEIVIPVKELETGHNVVNYLLRICSIKPTDIKTLRVKAGMDQSALAQEANMSNNEISRLENGLTSLTDLPFNNVVNLLMTLNTDNIIFKYLYDGEFN